VTLDIGARDVRTGDFAVKGGLAEGDMLIRYPTALLKEGQPTQASAPAAPTKAAATRDAGSSARN
jgi:membrane fusion protein, multidrug efflux system